MCGKKRRDRNTFMRKSFLHNSKLYRFRFNGPTCAQRLRRPPQKWQWNFNGAKVVSALSSADPRAARASKSQPTRIPPDLTPLRPYSSSFDETYAAFREKTTRVRVLFVLLRVAAAARKVTGEAAGGPLLCQIKQPQTIGFFSPCIDVNKAYLGRKKAFQSKENWVWHEHLDPGAWAGTVLLFKQFTRSRSKTSSRRDFYAFSVLKHGNIKEPNSSLNSLGQLDA